MDFTGARSAGRGLSSGSGKVSAAHARSSRRDRRIPASRARRLRQRRCKADRRHRRRHELHEDRRHELSRYPRRLIIVVFIVIIVAVIVDLTGRACGCGPGRPKACGTRRRPQAVRACEPRSIALPPEITIISSISTTEVRRWVEKIMVRPFATLSSVRLIAASVVWSSAEVASSSSSTEGSRTIARAIAMRWRWPPDSVSPRSPTEVSYFWEGS